MLSSTQKDIKTDKRLLDDSKKSTFTTSAISVFWGALALLALLTVGISFLVTDFDDRLAQNFNPQIDRITTASTSSGTRSIKVARRNKHVFDSKAQKKKIDDISIVIQRLRGEQVSLNNRVIELEKQLDKTRTHTKTLEKEIQYTQNKNKIASQTPRIITPQREPNLNPERSGKAIAKARNSFKAKTNQALPDKLVKEVKKSKATSGTTIVAKTTKSTKPSVDKTVVGSINIVNSSKFAIDLGVNSTKARAKGLWKELITKRPGILANLTPRYISTGKADGETRVVAGPFLDASDAIKACVAVRSTEGFCKTSLFPN
ncbi:MAG: SPOR domain-containing protein [Hyphomicrobiales bacterium]